MAYENGEETVHKMPTLFIIWEFQRQKIYTINKLLRKMFAQSERNKRRSLCKDCVRSQICGLNKKRSKCPTFDPFGHFVGVVRGRVYIALKKISKWALQNTQDTISTRLKNILNNNSHKACHGKITVNHTSIIRCRWNTTNHHLKRLNNGCTTQIHSPWGKWKYIKGLSKYFWLTSIYLVFFLSTFFLCCCRKKIEIKYGKLCFKRN